jgi:hypothetical protein
MITPGRSSMATCWQVGSQSDSAGEAGATGFLSKEDLTRLEGITTIGA